MHSAVRPVRALAQVRLPSGALRSVPLQRPASPRSPSALPPGRAAVKRSGPGRRPRVCSGRARRISSRSAAPLGFSACTDETRSRAPGAFVRVAPARSADPEPPAGGLPRRRANSDHRVVREPFSGGLFGFSDRHDRRRKSYEPHSVRSIANSFNNDCPQRRSIRCGFVSDCGVGAGTGGLRLGCVSTVRRGARSAAPAGRRTARGPERADFSGNP